MTKQLVQQMLEALDSKYIVNCGAWRVQRDAAITAARAYLEAPDEPVAWKCSACGAVNEIAGMTREDNWCSSCGSEETMNPLYAAQTENEAVRKANLDCVGHFNAMRDDLATAMAANKLLDSALIATLPFGAEGKVFEDWNKARKLIATIREGGGA